VLHSWPRRPTRPPACAPAAPQSPDPWFRATHRGDTGRCCAPFPPSPIQVCATVSPVNRKARCGPPSLTLCHARSLLERCRIEVPCVTRAFLPWGCGTAAGLCGARWSRPVPSRQVPRYEGRRRVGTSDPQSRRSWMSADSRTGVEWADPAGMQRRRRAVAPIPARPIRRLRRPAVAEELRGHSSISIEGPRLSKLNPTSPSQKPSVVISSGSWAGPPISWTTAASISRSFMAGVFARRHSQRSRAPSNAQHPAPRRHVTLSLRGHSASSPLHRRGDRATAGFSRGGWTFWWA